MSLLVKWEIREGDMNREQLIIFGIGFILMILVLVVIGIAEKKRKSRLNNIVDGIKARGALNGIDLNLNGEYFKILVREDDVDRFCESMAKLNKKGD